MLHYHKIVDAFGHISVRHPQHPNQFIMSTAIAPALATSQDLAIWNVSDASEVRLVFNPEANVPPGFLERCIHSEIYKTYPNISSVVHSHTSEVLPFAAAGVPLKAQLHTSGFLGATDGTPIFHAGDLSSAIVPHAAPHDLLIRTTEMGAALAATFIDDCHVVLMKCHGMVVRGESIRNAVFRAFYTKENATIQLKSALLGGGRQPIGLSSHAARDAMKANESSKILARNWNLWLAQIDQTPLYHNDLRE